MGSITTAGSSNWREVFEGHPGLAVTPENYELLLAELHEPAVAPDPEPEPEPVVVPDPIPEPSTPPESSPEPSEAPSDPEPELVRISDGEEGQAAE